MSRRSGRRQCDSCEDRQQGWGWYPNCEPCAEVIIEEPASRDFTIREQRGSETVVRHIHRWD